MKVVITGGHHNPAMPLVHELLARDKSTQIFWIGHRHTLKNDKNDTLEYIEVTKLGIPFYQLDAGKVYKTFNLVSFLKVPYGFIQAFFYLTKIRPNVIVSFGGYLAAPVVLAGFILGIPSVTHEQTVVAGYANRFISLFVKKIFISWEKSKEYFDQSKIVLSGLPIRKSISQVISTVIYLNPNLPTIYVTGGKTGSHVINLFVLNNLKKLLDVCNVIHQCGDYSVTNDFTILSAEYNKFKDDTKGKYFIQKFFLENEIGEVFLKSDLVISRSGANITAELLYLQKPCILIPIPWVSHNEQYENAKILVDAGLGEIIEEKLLQNNLSLNTVLIKIQNLNKHQEKTLINTNILTNSPEKIMADEIQKLTHS